MGYREPGESLRERLWILGCCTGSFSYQEDLKKKKNRYGIHNMFKTLPWQCTQKMDVELHGCSEDQWNLEWKMFTLYSTRGPGTIYAHIIFPLVFRSTSRTVGVCWDWCCHLNLSYRPRQDCLCQFLDTSLKPHTARALHKNKGHYGPASQYSINISSLTLNAGRTHTLI